MICFNPRSKITLFFLLAYVTEKSNANTHNTGYRVIQETFLDAIASPRIPSYHRTIAPRTVIYSSDRSAKRDFEHLCQ